MVQRGGTPPHPKPSRPRHFPPLRRKERAFLTGMNFDRWESLAGQHALTWRETIGIELVLGVAAANP